MGSIKRALLLLVLVGNLPAVADETEFQQIFLPERTGIPLGISLQDVASLMQTQGFLFGDPADMTGGQRPVIAMATPNMVLVDTFMAVLPEMGSLEYWNSSNVILGFKDSRLTLMAESAIFDRDEAKQVFEETKAVLSEHFGEEMSRARLPIDTFGEILGSHLIKEGMPMPYHVDAWATPEIYTMAAVMAVEEKRGSRVKTVYGKAKYFILHASICDYEFLINQVKKRHEIHCG